MKAGIYIIKKLYRFNTSKSELSYSDEDLCENASYCKENSRIRHKKKKKRNRTEEEMLN